MTNPTPARRLTGAIAAAAIALAAMTATAVPARANNDAAKILFGLTTLAIIGAAIANNARPAQAQPVQTKRPRHSGHGHGHRPHRPVPVVHLPEWCEIRTRHGSFYGARCLERAGFEGPLPDACAREIRTDRGWRVAYDGACLTGRHWR